VTGLRAQEGRPPLGAVARWVGDPLTWRHFSELGPKLRAAARRVYDAAQIVTANPQLPPVAGSPAGYLARTPIGRTAVPLYGASHPATGDQLLSTSDAEIRSMGYGEPVLLGYLGAFAPVTGRLGPTATAVPWASRFGIVREGL
jgi:hypothetical protein